MDAHKSFSVSTSLKYEELKQTTPTTTKPIDNKTGGKIPPVLFDNYSKDEVLQAIDELKKDYTIMESNKGKLILAK